jgi:hypothetical protein
MVKIDGHLDSNGKTKDETIAATRLANFKADAAAKINATNYFNEMGAVNFSVETDVDDNKTLVALLNLSEVLTREGNTLVQEGFADASGVILASAIDISLSISVNQTYLKCMRVDFNVDASLNLPHLDASGGPALTYIDEAGVSQTVSQVTIYGVDASGVPLLPASYLEAGNTIGAYFSGLGYTTVECVCTAEGCYCIYCKTDIKLVDFALNINTANYVGLMLTDTINGETIQSLLANQAVINGCKNPTFTLDASGSLSITCVIQVQQKCMYLSFDMDAGFNILDASGNNMLEYVDENGVSHALSQAIVYDGSVPTTYLEAANIISAFFTNTLGYDSVECVCSAEGCVCKYCKNVALVELPDIQVLSTTRTGNLLAVKIKNVSPNDVLQHLVYGTIKLGVFSVTENDVPCRVLYYLPPIDSWKIKDPSGNVYYLDMINNADVASTYQNNQDGIFGQDSSVINLPLLKANEEITVTYDVTDLAHSTTGKYAVYVDGPAYGTGTTRDYGGFVESDENNNHKFFEVDQSLIKTKLYALSNNLINEGVLFVDGVATLAIAYDPAVATSMKLTTNNFDNAELGSVQEGNGYVWSVFGDGLMIPVNDKSETNLFLNNAPVTAAVNLTLTATFDAVQTSKMTYTLTDADSNQYELRSTTIIDGKAWNNGLLVSLDQWLTGEATLTVTNNTNSESYTNTGSGLAADMGGKSSNGDYIKFFEWGDAGFVSAAAGDEIQIDLLDSWGDGQGSLQPLNVMTNNGVVTVDKCFYSVDAAGNFINQYGDDSLRFGTSKTITFNRP